MTYYPNRHDMIESDDIQDVQHVHIAKEGNALVAHIKATLSPRKDYQAAKQVYLHLTNGINHVVHGPFEHSKPVSTSTGEESSTSSEQSTELATTSTGIPTEATKDLPHTPTKG